MTDPHDQQSAPGPYFGPPPTDRNYAQPSPPPPGQYQPYGYPGQPGWGPHPGYGGYPSYPPPPPDRAPARPGAATTAAVLGWVNAGVLLVVGLLLLWGAAIVRDFEQSSSFTSRADATELLLLAIGNFVAGGLSIAGGVVFTGGRRHGRIMLAAGNVIVLGLFCYWLARSADVGEDGDGWLVWGLFFALVALLSTAFSFTASNNRWLTARE